MGVSDVRGIAWVPLPCGAYPGGALSPGTRKFFDFFEIHLYSPYLSKLSRLSKLKE